MRYLEDQFGCIYNLPVHTSNILGRKSDSDIPIPPLDVKQLDEVYYDVSRHHARVASEPEQCTIEDLYSTNGTKVDGNVLEAHKPQKLEDGSKVEMGRLSLTFHDG